MSEATPGQVTPAPHRTLGTSGPTVSATLVPALARHAPLILFVIVLMVFSTLSPAFRTAGNARNILVQSASVGIVSVGMTFVLLTGGIDLSVGAIMFVAAAVAGRLAIGGWIPSLPPVPVGITLMLLLPIGLLCGAVNATLIAGARLLPFVVTLATLFIGRGLALRITETRPIQLPAGFLAVGQATPLGVPLPVLILLATVILGQLILSVTPFGRQLFALGNNPEAARKAGLRTSRLLASVYLLSGLCAALGGIVSVAQLGAVSPTFGLQREFAAIAAAVLGGTSLFGGRGSVLPGTLLGALLIQTLESGLNILNADPYSYPVVIGAIILVAVLVDRFRHPASGGG